MLSFEQFLGKVIEFRHELLDVQDVVVDIPMLKAFDILVAFKLLPERGAEPSQNRLVKRIDLDGL